MKINQFTATSTADTASTISHTIVLPINANSLFSDVLSQRMSLTNAKKIFPLILHLILRIQYLVMLYCNFKEPILPSLLST